MDNCLSLHRTHILIPPLSPSQSHPFSINNLSPIRPFNDPQTRPVSAGLRLRRRAVRVTASAGASYCEEFSGLNSPLKPRSLAGKFLSGVLLNHRQLFHVAASEELKLLADDREAAVARMVLSTGSGEECLHRRIAQLKETECQIAVEDVMYMLITYNFTEIKVHLVPKLSSCVYNGRLELWPSKDWELESIHSLEVLEMIKEHVTVVTGLRPNCSIADSWAITKIRKLLLRQIYVASILYGYFLKSVSLRYHLERSLSSTNCNNNHLSHWTMLRFQEMCPYGLKNLLVGHLNNLQKVGQEASTQNEMREKLKCYVTGLNPESLQRFTKLRSKEAANLVRGHSIALFGREEADLFDGDEIIVTSFSSIKRLILEAVAFGSFLWETEDYIDNVYKLKWSR